MAKKKQTGRSGRRQPTGRKAIETMKKEAGAALPYLKKDIGRRFRGNALKQWQVLMRTMKPNGKPIGALIGLERECSDRTLTLYIQRGEAMLRLLPKLGVHIQELSDFSPKHVRALIEHMQEEEEEASTIQNQLTVMRRLLVWIDKVNALDAVDQIVRDAGVAERTYVVTLSKMLRSKGFSKEELFEASAAADKIFGSLTEMNVLFGLRRLEGTHLRPAESDEGDRLRVFRGTKGSKSRYVKIETPEQRAALDKAKAIAAATYAGGVLTWPRLSPEAAIERYKHFCKVVGLTKDGRFQTTPHGLRHEFAADKYFRLTGQLAQVESGLPVDPEVDRKARKVLAEEMGHGRIEVCGAYIGSNRIVVTQADRNSKALYERFLEPQVREPLQEGGITCLRLVGKVAEGAIDPKADTLCCYEGELTSDPTEVADLTAMLVKVVGGPCTLLPLTDALRARTDGLEVL